MPTLDGPQTLHIPHGTQSGRSFRLPGLGFPSRSGRTRGGEEVRVVIEVPRSLSREQEELLRQLRRDGGFQRHAEAEIVLRQGAEVSRRADGRMMVVGMSGKYIVLVLVLE